MEDTAETSDAPRGQMRTTPVSFPEGRFFTLGGQVDPHKPSRSDNRQVQLREESEESDPSTRSKRQPRIVNVDLSRPVGTMKMQQRRVTVGSPALSKTVESTSSATESEADSPAAAMGKITRGTEWLSEPVTVGADPLPARGRPGPTADSVVRVLVVAEKPSVALALARAVGNEEEEHTRPGVTPVHVVRGRFHGSSGSVQCEYWVTSVRGHVTTVDYPEGLDDWAAVDPLALFAARVKRVVCSGAVAGHLAQCARECSALVCATDADREGEHIAVEVATIAAPCLRPGLTPSVYRARFSGLGGLELRAAMQALGSLDTHAAAAVDARQEIDLKVGTALTRLQTRFVLPRWELEWARVRPQRAVEEEAEEEEPDGESGACEWVRGCGRVKAVPYGPCQTPTLALCVEREEDAARHIPERSWSVEVVVDAQHGQAGAEAGAREHHQEDHQEDSQRVGESAASDVGGDALPRQPLVGVSVDPHAPNITLSTAAVPDVATAAYDDISSDGNGTGDRDAGASVWGGAEVSAEEVRAQAAMLREYLSREYALGWGSEITGAGAGEDFAAAVDVVGTDHEGRHIIGAASRVGLDGDVVFSGTCDAGAANSADAAEETDGVSAFAGDAAWERDFARALLPATGTADGDGDGTADTDAGLSATTQPNQSVERTSTSTRTVTVSLPPARRAARLLAAAAAPPACRWRRGPAHLYHHALATRARVGTAATAGAEVISVQAHDRRVRRPLPLNTVELLVGACRRLGLSAQAAMAAAEELYLSGLITYPRTESTVYDQALDIRGTVLALARHPALAPAARAILVLPHPPRPSRGQNAGDHPAITPLAPPPASLQGPLGRLHLMVCQHFLATVLDDCVVRANTLTVRVAGELFDYSFDTMLSPGFTLAQPHRAPACLPPLDPAPVVGARLPVSAVRLRHHDTAPPALLSEADLVSMMAQLGIGTDASIPQHIHNITKRGYVAPGPGRRLVPTPLGRALIACYRAADPELCAPHLRARCEAQLALVARNGASAARVTEHILLAYRAKAVALVQRASLLEVALALSFRPRTARVMHLSEQRRAGLCGACGRYMLLLEGRNGAHVWCVGCQRALPLPSGGTLRVAAGAPCPFDGFSVMRWTSVEEHGTSYEFCPLCLTHQPAASRADGPVGCDACMHPTCGRALLANALSPCPNHARCGGMLLLQRFSQPRWRAQCNACALLVYIAPGAERVGLAAARAMLLPLGDLEDAHAIHWLARAAAKQARKVGRPVGKVSVSVGGARVQVRLDTGEDDLKEEKGDAGASVGEGVSVATVRSVMETVGAEQPHLLRALLRPARGSGGADEYELRAPPDPCASAEGEAQGLAVCGICESRLVVVQFPDEDNPVGGGRAWARGCLFCDPSLASVCVSVWGDGRIDAHEEGDAPSDSGRGRVGRGRSRGSDRSRGGRGGRGGGTGSRWGGDRQGGDGGGVAGAGGGRSGHGGDDRGRGGEERSAGRGRGEERGRRGRCEGREPCE